MKKKIIKLLSTVFIFSLISGTVVTSVQADEAIPTESTVLVNGQNVNFDAYNINGNNYFKLRDLAYVLNTTEKQFSVGYSDVLKTISLASRQPYVAVGGELTNASEGVIESYPTDSTILKDGEEVQLQVYLINDNNYFKLRDIGELFDFGVEWNEETNTVSINTGKSYEAENGDDVVIEDTTDDYYENYIVGENVEISGTVEKIEEFRGESRRSKGFISTAHVIDNNGNKWMVAMNLEEYGISNKEKDFDPFIGKFVVITGTYEGYSNWYGYPCVSMYEMKDVITGDTATGLLKTKELAVTNGVTFEIADNWVSDVTDGVISTIDAWLDNAIRGDMIDDFFGSGPNSQNKE